MPSGPWVLSLAWYTSVHGTNPGGQTLPRNGAANTGFIVHLLRKRSSSLCLPFLTSTMARTPRHHKPANRGIMLQHFRRGHH
ncbi:hypothetical protein EDD17DRAFT_1659836 [Pisolithus thermaeus]|nr:hypothetical protein EDD17DRAFT_1659836 [Pisolithus thermaeus]